ncbi:MAG: hypothetical protein M1834_005695 [Cirrosporium novae-zelandiae]|nr:MAG: hypothetical protein M1834_005695 [Cirrosporium novae-zelandiae]
MLTRLLSKRKRNPTTPPSVQTPHREHTSDTSTSISTTKTYIKSCPTLPTSSEPSRITGTGRSDSGNTEIGVETGTEITTAAAATELDDGIQDRAYKARFYEFAREAARACGGLRSGTETELEREEVNIEDIERLEGRARRVLDAVDVGITLRVEGGGDHEDHEDEDADDRVPHSAAVADGEAKSSYTESEEESSPIHDLWQGYEEFWLGVSTVSEVEMGWD